MLQDRENIDKLERKILFRILVFTVLATAGYLVMDFFLVIHENSIISGIGGIILFSTLAWLIHRNYHVALLKHVTTCILIVSIIGSFISFDGFKGVFLLDYINLIFLIFFIFNGIQRTIYGCILVLILAFTIYVHFYQSQYMHYLYEGEYENHYLLYGIVSRTANTMIIAISVKIVYEQERKNAIASNRELQAHIDKKNDIYYQLEMQSIEFQEQNEYIHELNMRLEERVNERTDKIRAKNKQLIEYAYFNAHKIRGPLARILGLIELTRVEKDIPLETLQMYFELVKKSALELDSVVQNINNLLGENEEDE